MTKQQCSNRRSLSPTTQILTCLKSHPVLNNRVMRMTQGLFFFSSSVSSSWQNKSTLEIRQKQSQDLFDGVKMYIYEGCEEERDEIWALKKGGEPYLIKNNHIKSAGQNFCEHKEISSRMLRNNVYRN